jgi:hypothetical protein
MTKTGKDIRDRLGNSPQAARISGQKGRPQSRPTSNTSVTKRPETRPQARNTPKGSVSKTVDSPSNTRVSGGKAPSTRPQARPDRTAPAASTRPRSRTESGKSPFTSTREAMAERRVSTQARPSVREAISQRRPQARPRNAQVNYSAWKNMSRAERQAAGLPTSEIGAQVYFRRFQEGI